MSLRSDIISIMIINDSDTKVANYIYASSDDPSSDYKKQPWYLSAMEAKGSPVITGPHIRNYLMPHNEQKRNLIPVSSVSRLIDNSLGTSTLGIMLIDANLNKIGSLCNSVRPNSQGIIFIMDTSGNIVYKPDGTKDEMLNGFIPELPQAKAGSFKASINDEENQIVYKHMERIGWIVFTKTKIRIKAVTDNDKLIITVSDNGIGMDAGMCNAILNDPGVQIDFSGSGIGIRNVNERIKLYLCSEYGIRFESAPEVGTTAIVYLPVIRD